MLSLFLACALFVAIHVVVSGTALRGVIVAVIGERPYLGVFSLASLAAVAWMALAYGEAPYIELWIAGAGLRHAALLLVLIATVFATLGLATPNPTAAGAEKLLRRENPATGVIKVTRHPLMWGIAIWAFAHLLVNGHAAALLLFGSLMVLAAFGPLLIDARHAKRDPAAWARLAAESSWLPFAALLQRRARVTMREIGWWRLGLAVVVYLALFYLHPLVIGVSPLPL